MEKSIVAKLKKAADDFKQKYGHYKEVFHIEGSDRYGEPVIAVGCISLKDEEKFREKISPSFQGFCLHFIGPIWNNLELIPELARRDAEMMQNSYYTSTQRGQEEMAQFLKEGIEKEQALWESWPEEKKRKFIIATIKEKKKHDPTFGNCGDKFFT